MINPFFPTVDFKFNIINNGKMKIIYLNKFSPININKGILELKEAGVNASGNLDVKKICNAMIGNKGR